MKREEPKWKGKHYAFFQNKECEYFPCHKGVREEDFNCLFCYCPLYMLGKACGGDFQYRENGVKDCKNCIRPHIRDNYGTIIKGYGLIQEQMHSVGYRNKNQQSLRCGITTGTCSTAAAVAAATGLFLGMEEDSISVITPKGLTVEVPVYRMSFSQQACEYMVKKDSGDDPDVTDQTPIHVRVERIEDLSVLKKLKYFFDEQYPGIYLTGGVGVGTVTKEGLEQNVGMPAINEVPRTMIFQGVYEVMQQAECEDSVLVTVFVPEGKELAKRTFNERLGIEGGISILGTSGIIEPMSEKAIIDTIEVEIRQLSRMGYKNLLVTPGNYGQTYASRYLGLDLSKSVKCSNYIGETIDLAISYGMENFLLVGNIGKLIKLAAGIMNTHSKVADGRGEILAMHTVLCGGTKEMAEKMIDCVNTEQMLTCLEQWNLKDPVIKSICKKIDEHLEHRVKGLMTYGVVLFSEKYGYLGATKDGEDLLKIFTE